MEEMNQIWHIDFPKGSGKNVDTVAHNFYQKYGMDGLRKVAKIHFKNTEKLLNQ